MISFGEDRISKLFLGDAEIQKAYLGETLVYEKRRASRLPEGYAEVKYIQSGSGQYINTNIAGSSVFKLEMDVEPLTASSGCFWGTRSSSFSTRELSCTKNGTTSVILRRPLTAAPYTVAVSRDTSNQRVKIIYDRSGMSFSVDSQEISISGSQYQVSALYLLYGNRGSTSYSDFTALNARLYSCKIYDSSGVLTRDFVPCIGPAGVPGAFDLANEKFYASGTGTFTAGPAV